MQSAEIVHRMEDILDAYHLLYDPDCLAICLDKNSIGLSFIEINRTPKLNDIIKRCVETQKAQSDEV